MFIVMLEIKNAHSTYLGLIKNLNEPQLKRYQKLFEDEVMIGDNRVTYRCCYEDLKQSFYMPPGIKLVDLTGALYVPLQLAS